MSKENMLFTRASRFILGKNSESEEVRLDFEVGTVYFDAYGSYQVYAANLRNFNGKSLFCIDYDPARLVDTKKLRVIHSTIKQPAVMTLTQITPYKPTRLYCAEIIFNEKRPTLMGFYIEELVGDKHRLFKELEYREPTNADINAWLALLSYTKEVSEAFSC